MISIVNLHSQLSTIITNPSIGQDNGEIAVDIAGDAGPFTLSVSPLTEPNQNYSEIDAGTYAFTQLSPGSYTIELKDKIGCVSTESITLSATDCPEVNIGIAELVHNTNKFYPFGEITVEIESELPLEDFMITWTKDGGAAPNYDNRFHIQNLDKAEYVITVTLQSDDMCSVSQMITILDCNKDEVFSGASCPGGSNSDVYCIKEISLVPVVNMVINNIQGVTNQNANDGAIAYSIIGNQMGTYVVNWENATGTKAYPNGGSMINNLTAGEWCYTLENGCGESNQGCVDIPLCSGAIEYALQIDPIEAVRGGCSQGNRVTINVLKDGALSSDETYKVEVLKYGRPILTSQVSQFPYLIDNLAYGEFDIKVTSACGDSKMTESFEFNSACDEQNANISTEFNGFRFSDDCNPYSLGIFGGLLSNGFNYNVEITDQQYLEDSGCDFTIRWPGGESSGLNQSDFRIKASPWNLSGDQSYDLFSGTPQPLQVVIEQSNGCEYYVTRPVCESELQNSGGVTTNFENMVSPISQPNQSCILLSASIRNFNFPSCEVCLALNGIFLNDCSDIKVELYGGTSADVPAAFPIGFKFFKADKFTNPENLVCFDEDIISGDTFKYLNFHVSYNGVVLGRLSKNEENYCFFQVFQQSDTK